MGFVFRYSWVWECVTFASLTVCGSEKAENLLLADHKQCQKENQFSFWFVPARGLSNNFLKKIILIPKGNYGSHLTTSRCPAMQREVPKLCLHVPQGTEEIHSLSLQSACHPWHYRAKSISCVTCVLMQLKFNVFCVRVCMFAFVYVLGKACAWVVL